MIFLMLLWVGIGFLISFSDRPWLAYSDKVGSSYNLRLIRYFQFCNVFVVSMCEIMSPAHQVGFLLPSVSGWLLHALLPILGATVFLRLRGLSLPGSFVAVLSVPPSSSVSGVCLSLAPLLLYFQPWASLDLHFWGLGINVFALYSVDAEFPMIRFHLGSHPCVLGLNPTWLRCRFSI